MLFEKQEQENERNDTHQDTERKIDRVNSSHYLALETMPKETATKIKPTMIDEKTKPSVKPRTGSQTGKDSVGIDV